MSAPTYTGTDIGTCDDVREGLSGGVGQGRVDSGLTAQISVGTVHKTIGEQNLVFTHPRAHPTRKNTFRHGAHDDAVGGGGGMRACPRVQGVVAKATPQIARAHGR